MARCCKRGGLVINSMTFKFTEVTKYLQITKQYLTCTLTSTLCSFVKFVDEYKNIDLYVKELDQFGVWREISRQILDDYIIGKKGLVHAMQVQ